MAKKDNTNLIIGLVAVGLLVVVVALYLSQHHSNGGDSGGGTFFKCSDNCAKPHSTGSVDNGDYETQSRCCSGCGVTGGVCN